MQSEAALMIRSYNEEAYINALMIRSYNEDAYKKRTYDKVLQ